ncbi:MAG: CocE/NonD family hydrolase [Actinobacteria bacterium]|nr:CocE/NonD family hydrolase [Actinomycetota bacterium]
MRVEWDVPIRMDDGTELRADIFRPPDDGAHPVILTYGPYAKGLSFQEGYPDQWAIMVREHPDVSAGSSNKYQNWEVVDPEKWVPDGYACVRVDSRGAGRSPGYIDPFSPRETRDFYLCIEWAGNQAWSNGKVGLNGISYYGINQWHVATLNPPHLAAMCIWEGAADWYRDMTHHGGILCTFWDNWFDKQVLTVQHGLGSRGPRDPNTGELVCGPETLSDVDLEHNRVAFGDEILSHPLDDEYHQVRSPTWERITVPFLSASNWGGQGLHARGNFEGYVRADSDQKWLEVHGLEHWTHFYTDYGLALQKRFFAHFLKGEQNDWTKQPPVQLQVRHVDGSFKDRAENEWPIARCQWTRLYLNAAERLSLDRTPPEVESEFEFEALGDGLTFSTPPIEEEVEITGPIAAKLFVSSSTVDCDLFLVVRVFDQDDREVVFQGALDPNTPVAQGWLRASHRKLDPTISEEWRPYHTHDEVQPLQPGVPYELDIEIWPTCIVVPAGYRISLTVRGKDYEHSGGGARLSSFANEMTGCGPFLHDDPRDRPPDIFGGTTTICAGGDRASYVLLPIIPDGGGKD